MTDIDAVEATETTESEQGAAGSQETSEGHEANQDAPTASHEFAANADILDAGDDTRWALAAMHEFDAVGAEALVREWGDDTPANLGYARTAATQLLEGVPEERRQALMNAVGDDPVVIRELTRIGREIRHPITETTQDKPIMNIQEIENKIEAKQAERDAMMDKGNYARAEALDKGEIRELYARLVQAEEATQ